jgi:hypothetical protein
MTEKFNRDYRFFAEAAKEIGIDDVETRKIIAEDSSLLIDEMSPELQSKITPKHIADLFNILVGNGKEVEPLSILAIGNALYSYRRNARESGEMNGELNITEQDKEKINLAYVLVENAVYEGNLATLSKEQKATLAFMINTMGKLFIEEKADGLRGFDQAKFDTFVKKVAEFETKCLSENNYIKNDRSNSIENTKLEIDQKLKEEREKLIKLQNEIDPEFERIVEALDTVRKFIKEQNTLIDNYILVKNLDDLYFALVKNNNFNKNLLSGYFKKVVEQALERIDKNTDRTEQKGKVLHTYSNLPIAEQIKWIVRHNEDRFGKSDFISENVHIGDAYVIESGMDSLPNLLKVLRKKADEIKKKPGKQQIIRDFQTLAENTAQNKIPEIIELLESSLIENGLFKQLGTSDTLIKKKKDVIRFDNSFEKSMTEILKTKGPASIAYAFKSLLIAGDMKGDSPLNHEHLLSLNPQGPAKVYPFLQNNFGEDADKGPAYANLHYLPSHMPFSAFAWDYLKSIKKPFK